MSIDKAEQLKRELTDKFVVVLSGVPELRRFTGYTGRVKTVNMSGRALVQFDSPVDIGWYDIEPDYLKVVDAPAPKAETSHAAKEAAPAKPAAAKPAAATEGKKLSPLELARQQGAKKSGAAAAAPATGAAPAAAKKLSPLELARQQGAAKKAGAAPAAQPAPQAAAPAEAAPAETPAAAPEAPAPVEAPAAAPATGKKLSPLELARQQGAFKKKPK